MMAHDIEQHVSTGCKILQSAEKGRQISCVSNKGVR